MSDKIVIWYDPQENAVKFALNEDTLTLNKNEYSLVIPLDSKIFSENPSEDIEQELTEFYLSGYGELVLIVSPGGDTIGLILAENELEQLFSKIFASNGPKESFQEISSATEDLEQPS